MTKSIQAESCDPLNRRKTAKPRRASDLRPHHPSGNAAGDNKHAHIVAMLRAPPAQQSLR